MVYSGTLSDPPTLPTSHPAPASRRRAKKRSLRARPDLASPVSEKAHDDDQPLNPELPPGPSGA
ncbi:MAG TPA: hypothetical protein PK413_01495 [Thermoanaerobaculia bacterium]|nr:hypothetical protein [Thermoanaerobaculia bacterium]